MTSYAGGCHCGAIRLGFDTPVRLRPRACQCSFCRKHSARTVSDPEGAATIGWADELGVIRYRFASLGAEYLICRHCGVYVGAMADLGGAIFATLNLNAFDDPHPDLAAERVSYDAESAGLKASRRRARWTPCQLGPARH